MISLAATPSAGRPQDPETAAADSSPAAAGLATIGAVERDTGLGKDTLRVWEKRYGFPQPLRDPLGERLYPPEQVQQLRQVKRLLDAGHRPGRVVGLPLRELLQLGEREAPAAARGKRPLPPRSPSATATTEHVIDLLAVHDVQGLRRLLSQALLRMGLERFICDLAAPLTTAIGAAWAQGRLQIHEEHLCSEVLEGVLRNAIFSAASSSHDHQPRVLLSTLPDEPHRLGLLMAEALFLVHGCECISLGVQTPLDEICSACAAHQVQIVALSLTPAINANRALQGLVDLRAQIPAAVEIWVGTLMPALHHRGVAGVRLFDHLDAIGPQLLRRREVEKADSALP